MLIYCNGDSFVAGVELADDLLPDYPGLSDFGNPSEKAREWIANTYNPKHHYSKIREERCKELIQVEYSRAFPNKLHEILNVPVVNHGLGGSSMDRIVRTTITSLIELKKTHDNIIAIIGDTDCNRSEVPNYESFDYEDAVGFAKYWQCLSSNYHMSNREPLEPLIEYKLRYEKNYHSLVNYYKNVIMLQDFCANNNITLYWLESYGRGEIVPESQYDNDTCLTNLKEYAGFKYTIRMSESAEKIYNNVLCPSGHYGENVHTDVANILATIIKETHNV